MPTFVARPSGPFDAVARAAEDSTTMHERTPPPRDSAAELLGQLAEEISLLVRSDVEVSAAHRIPEARRIARELTAALAVAVAAILALGALTWAAIAALATGLPAWGAALIVGAAWSAVAALLLQLDHPRRLLARLRDEVTVDAIVRVELERVEAERAMRTTAERLAEAIGREAVDRELRAPIDRAEQLLGAAGSETDDLARDLAAALLAPGKAGLSLIELLIGRRRHGGR
jgi:hypothetical protein